TQVCATPPTPPIPPPPVAPTPPPPAGGPSKPSRLKRSEQPPMRPAPSSAPRPTRRRLGLSMRRNRRSDDGVRQTDVVLDRQLRARLRVALTAPCIAQTTHRVLAGGL